MTRVLNKFYTAEDLTTDSWCVIEHTNKPWDHVKMTNLTEAEAIVLANKLNKEYEDEKALRR